MSDNEQELPKSGQDAPATGPSEDTAPDKPGAEAGEPSLEERFAALAAEAAEYKDRLLREMAEMENLRRRTQREKDEAARYAITRFARDVIGVSDDLARAIAAVPEDARSDSEGPIANLLSGIELTERQMQQVLERHGVTRFDPSGQKFDPAVHEAMFQIPDPGQPDGTVAQVMEVGYMIGERVLRPARVGVTAGGPKAEAAKPAPQAGAPDAPAPEASAEPARTNDAQESSPGQGGSAEAAAPDQVGIKVDRSA